jgi:hypothetical protein
LCQQVERAELPHIEDLLAEPGGVAESALCRMARVVGRQALGLQVPRQPFLVPGHLFSQLPVLGGPPETAAQPAEQDGKAAEHQDGRMTRVMASKA